MRARAVVGITILPTRSRRVSADDRPGFSLARTRDALRDGTRRRRNKKKKNMPPRVASGAAWEGAPSLRTESKEWKQVNK